MVWSFLKIFMLKKSGVPRSIFHTETQKTTQYVVVNTPGGVTLPQKYLTVLQNEFYQS